MRVCNNMMIKQFNMSRSKVFQLILMIYHTSRYLENNFFLVDCVTTSISKLSCTNNLNLNLLIKLKQLVNNLFMIHYFFGRIKKKS